jgi:hypothetical protein
MGGVNATLKAIETTLSGLGTDIKNSRVESEEWRQRFRDQLKEHADRTDKAIDGLSTRTTTLEVELQNHMNDVEGQRKLMWRVILGGGGGGATLFAAWNQAKAAIVAFFK